MLDSNLLVFSSRLISLLLLLLLLFSVVLVLFVCCCYNHGRRFPLDLLREEPRRRAAAAAAGGGLPPLHAVAEHGIAQPVGQVLRKSSALLPNNLCARVGCSTICLTGLGGFSLSCLCAAGRQVHPGQVGDGHGHGALPAHGAQEGQGERGGVPLQGGVPEAARREAAQQPDADPRLQEQAAGAGERHGC